MKMATLSWTNLNPTVKTVDTKKKFFNRYLYKIVLHVPGCRLVSSKSTASIQALLDYRLGLVQYNTRRFSNRDRGLHQASVPQLEYFRNIIEFYGEKIKIRIEEPILTLYSDDEEILMEIAKMNPESLSEIHRPSSDVAITALNRGECLLKRPTPYTHKVMFKESATLSTETKNSIYDYLINLGDVVKLTKSCQRNLTGRQYWFTATYFYTKDESILTFLNLIAPGAIAGIYKLTNVQ